jgi:hypothetical protein
VLIVFLLSFTVRVIVFVPDEERIVLVSSGILMAKVRNFLIDVLAELTLDGFYLFRPQEAKLEKKQNCPLFGQKLYFP